VKGEMGRAVHFGRLEGYWSRTIPTEENSERFWKSAAVKKILEGSTKVWPCGKFRKDPEN
jgi:hypothetical protein